MIEQNRWSACRYGVEGSMVDLVTGGSRPTRALLTALLEELDSVSDELEIQAELAVAAGMVETNGAIAQREVARGSGARAVVQSLAERFLDPPVG
jgi:carboxylate-amine ligase